MAHCYLKCSSRFLMSTFEQIHTLLGNIQIYSTWYTDSSSIFSDFLGSQGNDIVEALAKIWSRQKCNPGSCKLRMKYRCTVSFICTLYQLETCCPVKLTSLTHHLQNPMSTQSLSPFEAFFPAHQSKLLCSCQLNTCRDPTDQMALQTNKMMISTFMTTTFLQTNVI